MMDHLDCLLITYQSHLRQIQDLMFQPFKLWIILPGIAPIGFSMSSSQDSRANHQEKCTYSLPATERTNRFYPHLRSCQTNNWDYHFAILKLLNVLSFFSFTSSNQNDRDLDFLSVLTKLSLKIRSKVTLKTNQIISLNPKSGACGFMRAFREFFSKCFCFFIPFLRSFL
jgi:hypothetical protein